MRRSAIKVILAAVITAFLASACVAHAEPTVEPSPAENTVIPTATATAEPTVTLKPTPYPIPEPTPTPDPVEYNAAFIEAVLECVNEARAEHGLDPLELSPALCAAAAVRAEELKQKVVAVNQLGYFSISLANDDAHSRMNGDWFQTVIDEVGISRWKLLSENVVYGRFTGISARKDGFTAFRWWKDSPPHWAAILTDDYTHTGISVIINEYGWYACQLFIAGHKEPEVIPSLTPQTLPPDWTPQPEDSP